MIQQIHTLPDIADTNLIAVSHRLIGTILNTLQNLLIKAHTVVLYFYTKSFILCLDAFVNSDLNENSRFLFSVW